MGAIIDPVFHEANMGRAAVWHKGKPWTLERWFTAFVGEVGELGNVLKKNFRILDDLPNKNPDDARLLDDRAKVRLAVAMELADVFTYFDILRAECEREFDLNFDWAVSSKFNKVSEMYGMEWFV